MISCMNKMKNTPSRFAPAATRKGLRSSRQWRRDVSPSSSLSQSPSPTRSLLSQSQFSSSPPKVPPPSHEFTDVLYKLRFGASTDGATYNSDDEVTVNTTRHRCGILTNKKTGKAINSSATGSLSAPASNTNTPKQRRTVRFDEATITSTAEFGETAARFRSQSRKKRSTSSPPSEQQTPCFGGSRNITITHDDLINDVTVTTPTKLMQHPKSVTSSSKNPRSIFDACDVFTYTGRFT